MKRKRNYWRILSTIITVISIAFLGWIFISWVDIIADNMMPNPHHYPWNFFVILFK